MSLRVVLNLSTLIRILNLSLFLNIFVGNCVAQTRNLEEEFLRDAHNFEIVLKLVARECMGLTKEQKSKLQNIDFKIDTILNSNSLVYSNKNAIVIGEDLIRNLAKIYCSSLIKKVWPDPYDFVGRIVNEDTIPYRKYKMETFTYIFMNNFLPINSDIDPEYAAELNSNENKLYKNKLEDPAFFKDNPGLDLSFAFIYYHELAHILLNHKSKKSNRKIEIEADSFAISALYSYDSCVVNKGNIMPFNPAVKSLQLFSIFRINKFDTYEDLIIRKNKLADFCIKFETNRGTLTSSDSLAFVIIKNNLENTERYHLNNKSINKIKKSLKKQEPQLYISDLISLAEIYLTGSPDEEKDINKALIYYKMGASMNALEADVDNQFNSYLEVCRLMCGKINEWHLLKIDEAIKYFYKAQEISIVFPKNYYDRIIKRLENSM